MYTSWTTSCHIKPDEIDVKFFVEDMKRLEIEFTVEMAAGFFKYVWIYPNYCQETAIVSFAVSREIINFRSSLLQKCWKTQTFELPGEKIRALCTSVCATIHVKLCEDFFVELGKYVKFTYIPLLTKFPSENIDKKIMKDSCSYVNDIVKESIPSGLHSVGFNWFAL